MRTVVVDPEPFFAQGVVTSLTGQILPDPVAVGWGSLVACPGPGGAAVVGVRPAANRDTDVVHAALESQTPTIVVGSPGNTRGVAELQQAGVCEVLSRDCHPQDLITALQTVGRQVPAPRRTESRGPLDPPRRELEVTTLLAKGLSNREIAGALFISEHTVRNHLGHVFSKLAVSSRTQAVVRAGEIGWLRLPG